MHYGFLFNHKRAVKPVFAEPAILSRETGNIVIICNNEFLYILKEHIHKLGYALCIVIFSDGYFVLFGTSSLYCGFLSESLQRIYATPMATIARKIKRYSAFTADFTSARAGSLTESRVF